MQKTFVLLAATVSGHTKRDMTNLHSSLEGMLSEVKATYHTDAAYRVAKRASDSEVLSLQEYAESAEDSSSDGFYNKYTDYYSAPCSGDYYYGVYQYSDAFRSYVDNYCNGSYN